MTSKSILVFKKSPVVILINKEIKETKEKLLQEKQWLKRSKRNVSESEDKIEELTEKRRLLRFALRKLK